MSRERGREVEKQDVLTKLAELRENSNEADSAASLMIEAVRRSLLASKSSIVHSEIVLLSEFADTDASLPTLLSCACSST